MGLISRVPSRTYRDPVTSTKTLNMYGRRSRSSSPERSNMVQMKRDGAVAIESILSKVQAGVQKLEVQAELNIRADEAIELDIPLDADNIVANDMQVTRLTRRSTGTRSNADYELVRNRVSTRVSKMRLTGIVHFTVEEDLLITLPLKVEGKAEHVEQSRVAAKRSMSAEKPVLVNQGNYAAAATGPKQYSIFITVRELSKSDPIGKPDPYFIFKLDGQKIAGGAEFKIPNKLSGAWSFNIKAEAIISAKRIIVEIWDKDTIGKDDFMGSYSVTVDAFLNSVEGLKEQGMEGKYVKKAKMDLTWKAVE